MNADCDHGTPAHLRMGINGENASAAFLSASGYTILARNWRHGHLEIDIICEKEGCIVFVEVKTRKRRSYGGGYGAVNRRKQLKLKTAAQYWLIDNKRLESPCQFDVLCVYPSGEYFRVEHYADAF